MMKTKSSGSTRQAIILLGIGFAPLTALALLSFNDGRDTVSARAAAGWSYDSNVFGNRDAASDSYYAGNLGIEYERRAGVIAMRADAAVNIARFDTLRSEDYENPDLSLEFTKESGRLKGGLNLGARKESRADTAANIRTNHWNNHSSLDLRYPVNIRWYLTSRTAYEMTRFPSESALIDHDAVSQAVHAFYVLNSRIDIAGGYRSRWSQTGTNRSTRDHAFTAGVTGALTPKISGHINFGWQIRQDRAAGGSFGSPTAGVSLVWAPVDRLDVQADVSRDFATTSTDLSIDGASYDIRASYTVARRFTLKGGAGYFSTRYLGTAGLGRRDEGYRFNTSVRMDLPARFGVVFNYGYDRNLSNEEFAEFERHHFGVNLDARF